mmetsp:Transcript_28463/g.46140  ORF Transcript_28463/g.46140 Transcript_28463/m.46140 type:complete len:271 (+) Transcript_28463:888-1700(+)
MPHHPTDPPPPPAPPPPPPSPRTSVNLASPVSTQTAHRLTPQTDPSPANSVPLVLTQIAPNPTPPLAPLHASSASPAPIPTADSSTLQADPLPHPVRSRPPLVYPLLLHQDRPPPLVQPRADMAQRALCLGARSCTRVQRRVGSERRVPTRIACTLIRWNHANSVSSAPKVPSVPSTTTSPAASVQPAPHPAASLAISPPHRPQAPSLPLVPPTCPWVQAACHVDSGSTVPTPIAPSSIPKLPATSGLPLVKEEQRPSPYPIAFRRPLPI